MIQLFLPDTKWEAFFQLRSNKEVGDLISSAGHVPQTLLDMAKSIFTLKKDKIIDSDMLHSVFSCLLSKGPQTGYKHDSLGAYLSFHPKSHLPDLDNCLYFVRKNQIHFYDFEMQRLSILKVYRKKKKFYIKTKVSYSQFGQHFYFFAHEASNKAVQVTYLKMLANSMIGQKCEVEYFKSLRGISILDPQIFSVEPQPGDHEVYIFNERKVSNPKTSHQYYNSYIIKMIPTGNKSGQLNQDFVLDSRQESFEGPINSAREGNQAGGLRQFLFQRQLLQQPEFNESSDIGQESQNSQQQQLQQTLSTNKILIRSNKQRPNTVEQDSKQFSPSNAEDIYQKTQENNYRSSDLTSDSFKIKIYEGPRNYQWHKEIYYFYDKHNK